MVLDYRKCCSSMKADGHRERALLSRRSTGCLGAKSRRILLGELNGTGSPFLPSSEKK